MIINIEAVKHLLGIKGDLPLSPQGMAKSLEVTFFPSVNMPEDVNSFSQRLKRSLKKAGVRVLEFDQVCVPDSLGRKKIRNGVAVFFVGKNQDNLIPMDYVGSLSNNPLVVILKDKEGLQEDLSYMQSMDMGLKFFTRHMCHLAICFYGDHWKLYSYNGFSERFDFKDFSRTVLYDLVPKIATRVLPPKLNEFSINPREEDFIDNSKLAPYIKDLVKGVRLITHAKIFSSVKNVNEFQYTSPLYRRIAGQYFDERTGMSYGYIARQLPSKLSKPMPYSSFSEHQNVCKGLFRNKEGKLFLLVIFERKKYLMLVPDVWVLMSRSGSNKTRLNAKKDIILIGLKDGNLQMDVPKSVDLGVNYRPSFDTRLILAHCLSNVIYASLLKYFSKRDVRFANMIEKSGSALIHWHGNISKELVPRGWYIYGGDNPPVLCSSPQSALYAFVGKENAIIESMYTDLAFLGDLHIEPQHGINIVGPTLKRLSHFLFSSSLLG